MYDGRHAGDVEGDGEPRRVMRPLLIALLCVACAPIPTAPRVVSRSASSYGFQQDTLLPFPASPVPCTLRHDSTVVWIGGMKYLEIVEVCH